MDIAGELKRVRLKTGLSQQKFAESLGIPQRTWSNYESGRNSPKMAFLFELAEKGYTIPGLTTGLELGLNRSLTKAGMSKEEQAERLEIARAKAKDSPPDTPIDDRWAQDVDAEYKRRASRNTLKVYEPSELPDGSFVVPLLDQRLSAGAGSYVPEEDEATALIRVPGYLARYGENIAALTVDGDSMHPTLQRGDMVVCDSCGWSGEGVYALRMGGEGFVKRLTKAPGKIVILSDNPKYPTREEPENSQDIQIIGRVHCAITKVD